MPAGASPGVAFICTDTLGHGGEVCASAEASVGDVVASVIAALGGEGAVEHAAEELQAGEPSFWAQHVHQTQLAAQLAWADRVPQHLFFAIERGGQAGPALVVGLSVLGLRFRGRNALLEERARCVLALLDDMNAEFGKPEYQEKLKLAKDRWKVQTLIRGVHLKVLPAYGFSCLGASEDRVLELVLQMQGFIQSGLLTEAAREASAASLVASGYSKMKSLPSGPRAWGDRHSAAAADFRELLLRIRREGAQRFQEEMIGLWRAADRAQGSSQSPFGRIANKTLLSFSGMAEALCRDAAGVIEEDGMQAEVLQDLVGAAIGLLDKPALTPISRLLLGVQPEQLDAWPFDAHGGSLTVLLLVWLPLAFYVRNTVHLYEMLERLQLRAPHMEGAFQADAGMDGAEALRAMLNRDDRHYAYLLFAVVAALQTLRLAGERLGRRGALALLGSSPPGNCVNGYPMGDPGEWPDSQLLFRGIWVGPEVDEERARFQYSFQSFSRDLVGMATVLSFYAGVGGSTAQRIASTHRRVLIFVVRAWWFQEDCLALPVQFFDGPQQFDSEREVLLPPYVQYRLEDDLSLCSDDFPLGVPSKSAVEKLEKLERRWPGFTVPDLLVRMLQRESPPEFAGLLYQHMQPFISVRFIHKAVLPAPLRPLFRDPSLRLYDFEGGA
uniref:Uncharacterized protein n=1 Tax=Alexandrium monilatum TaxID=311494 RepID=A0A7S4QMX8_9DINO